MTPHTKFGFINDKFRCEVCGQMGGLKAICTHPGCVKKHEGDGDTTESLYFHPTCARHAGLEVAEGGDALHCGALADAQEAMDELDALAGVLEPFEAIFCLDIVERSIRDVLIEAPWTTIPVPVHDLQAWQAIPPYRPHRSFLPPNDPENPVESQEADESWRLDEQYLETVRKLRIEEE